MNSNLDFSELDEWTEKIWNKAQNEYPAKAKKVIEKCCKRAVNTAKANTPEQAEGSTHTKKKWKYKVSKKNKKGTMGKIFLASKKGHLIEFGHVAANGRFVEGAHMLEKTLATEENAIKTEISTFVDKFIEGMV